MYKVVKIKRKSRPLFQKQLEELESKIIYPFGDDFFTLNHGSNYFQFFDRLGEAHHYAALKDNRIVALGCGIVRNVPLVNGGTKRVWYLCDLKSDPAHRGGNYASKMLLKGIIPGIFKSRTAYMISMDSTGGTNKLSKLLNRNPLVRFEEYGEKLLIYGLDFHQMRKASSKLKALMGEIRYLSLKGVKDLVLESTKKEMPLLHLQWESGLHMEPTDNLFDEPIEGFEHMFCALQNSRVQKLMSSIGIVEKATATIIHRGAHNLDFGFVRTSDI